MRMKKLAAALGGMAASLSMTAAFASGPLNLNPNDPDNFTRWANGGQNIPYNPDQGGLATLNNAQAVQFVTDAYQVWEDVPTSTATYANTGLLPFDVDETNFAPFIQNLFFGTNTSDGLSPIVFDEDGAIFLALFGPSGVLGFASADTFDADGVPIEGVAFLNGGAVLGGFPLFPDFFGVFVHEFGHYSGMAHTIVNGQAVALGDTSGPTPFDDFGPPPPDSVETMYPFLIVGGGQESLHADDVSFYSRLYPEPGFLDNTVTITGQILGPNATTPLTGVNVIARNVADPFGDAVSAISGDRGVTGEYTINGLTPGAEYRLFVDSMGPTQGAGAGFSTPGISLPGPEEYYNGALESEDGLTDDPADFVLLSAGGGDTLGGTDVIFNGPAPGQPLQLGDDDFVELFLPFEFDICGAKYGSVFVNSNGSVTFGAGSTDFSESASDLHGGPPRIAGVWDDLNPSAGGVVTFGYKKNETKFTIYWQEVPEFPATGANSFSITLLGDQPPHKYGSRFVVDIGDLTLSDGLAGFSCGEYAASGFEAQTDISSLGNGEIRTQRASAIFEIFNGASPNDLANTDQRYSRSQDFDDVFEADNFPNDSFATASPFDNPGDTIPLERFSEITPDRDSLGPSSEGDVDYYTIEANGGELLTVALIAGGIDSILGLFDGNGNLIAQDDDGQGTVGGLSIIEDFTVPATGTYYIAVSTWPDFDYDGIGGLGGEGRYVMDVSVTIPPPGDLLSLGDDDFEEVPLQFSFPYQGSSYNSVFVNSNGNLTFGSGDTDFSESVSEFLNDQPRIAPLWDDLSPNQGGFISVLSEATQATVFFQDVPQFLAGDENNFSVTLRDDGSITVEYGAVDAGDGLAGVTPGGGLPGGPGAVDLSGSADWGASGSTYEQFNSGNPVDLELSTTNYTP